MRKIFGLVMLMVLSLVSFGCTEKVKVVELPKESENKIEEVQIKDNEEISSDDEIIKRIKEEYDYNLIRNEVESLKESIKVEDLVGKSEEEVKGLFGDPRYVLEYKLKNEEDFTSKILVYTYHREPTGVRLNFKDGLLINGYIDELNGMEDYQIESMIYYFKN